jgi:hypothetical protein
MSNNRNCLKITNEDRRYLPIQVSYRNKQNTAYFGNIRDTCFNPDFANQFGYHLMSLLDDPNIFIRRPIPNTDIKKEMIADSDYLSPFWDFVLEGNVPVSKIFTYKKISYHAWSNNALWAAWKGYQVENHFGTVNNRIFLNKLKSSKKFEYIKSSNDSSWYQCIESDKMQTDAIDSLEFDE